MLNGSIYILSIAMYIDVFVRTKTLLALHRKTEGEGCNKITVLGDITPSHRANHSPHHLWTVGRLRPVSLAH